MNLTETDTQKVTRKSALEILKETVDWYGFNPKERRANWYTYFTADGKSCAVSRCFDPEMPVELYNTFLENNTKNIRCIFRNGKTPFTLDDALSEEYRGHSIGFWSHLQELHDYSLYWSDSGITSSGIRKIGLIQTLLSEGKI